jgi:hypothetical protein
MNIGRRTARIVGVSFIVATVTSSLGVVLLGSILDAPDYLINVYPNGTQVIIGVLFLLVNCAAVVVIPAMLFPILKKQNEGLALGYVGYRIIESVILIVGSVSPLSLITLSQEFVGAGAPDASHFLTLGNALLAAHDWTILLSVDIVFPLGALVFYSLSYRSRLVPRWLSGWGFVGAALWLAVGLLRLFGASLPLVLSLPIFVQELVLGVWLIVRGFNPSAITSPSARQD